MIDTVLFDMGGTLEDIYVDDASKEASAREVLRILKEKGFSVSMDVPEAMQELAASSAEVHSQGSRISSQGAPERRISALVRISSPTSSAILAKR